MNPLVLLALGFAPGIFWLWMIVRGNRHRPDPMALVIRTFLLGVAIAVPVVVIESIVQGSNGSGATMPFGEAVFVAFVVAGLVEEFGKFLIVRLSIFDSPYFDEPLRGLVYAGAVALGFASIENVGYMLSFGPGVIVPRALLSTLGHVFFSALWGYGLGADRRARLDGLPSRGYAVLGLIGAIAAHGMFDVLLFIDKAPLAVLVFLVAGVAFAVLLTRANGRSIHRGRTVAPSITCTACAATSPAGSRFCMSCGASMAPNIERRCGGCQTPLVGHPAYCAACGARVGDARE